MIYKYITSLLMLLTCSGTLCAQSLSGDWTGKLELGPVRSLKVILHISESSSTITLDSPDQGAYGLNCNVAYLAGDSVSLTIPNLMLSYSGHAKDNELTGNFQQGGINLPLTFARGIKKADRPQTPIPPFPYKEENVKIENASENAVLAGTLTIPQNYSEATPVVVMVSGSGPQNRDEELFEHKPFAVIADFLARNGIASLRYDDRGFGESTGDRTKATIENFASDAESVINWIREQNRFGKVGMMGHSEGGLIAYKLGNRNDFIDFIISIAGPSVTGAEILDYQNKAVLMQKGLKEKEAEKHAIKARKQIEKDPNMTWMHYFLQYDPSEDLCGLKVPALIMYGEKDQQVPVSLNLEKAQKTASGAIVKCFPNLNHLMQEAETGAVEEYRNIEQTISPTVLSEMLNFIMNQSSNKK